MRSKLWPSDAGWQPTRARLCFLALCVVALFALSACGSVSAASGSPPAPTQTQTQAQTQTRQAGQYSVTMTVTPAKFGNNTMTVMVKTASGAPLIGGKLVVTTSMVEMDMGSQTIPLTPTSPPGTYRGQSELVMAGHWRLDTTIQTPSASGAPASTTFTIAIGY